MNRIDGINSKSGLMTHVVAGYPDMETSRELIYAMAESGVGMIEIQIPFSDPLADGPTIMKANQVALNKGVSINECFELVASVRGHVDIPLLFMSYANIPFRYGLKQFIQDSSQVGIDGLIIPDIPFDEQLDYIGIADSYGVYPIQVVSPDIEFQRLQQIVKIAKGFIYTTLKVGVTGAGKKIPKEGIMFVNRLKEMSGVPVMAGFGISSKEHVCQVLQVADGAVIGSHIINLLNEQGIESVKRFLISLSEKN